MTADKILAAMTIALLAAGVTLALVARAARAVWRSVRRRIDGSL